MFDVCFICDKILCRCVYVDGGLLGSLEEGDGV